ncbi:MAG: amidohydrolase [Bdellovibrionales bacterium]|nr:amidohydrolase [Bdellovibrionales bacterium]
MSNVKKLIEKHLPRIIEIRRDIHSHPELAFEEVETSKKVVSVLSELGGWDIQPGVAKTGVVAILGADKPGPCVGLRADMDALPIYEETKKPYASKRPGVMHACGHDGHTACLLGAAMVLTEIKDELSGPVRLLFQPAEEGHGGGKLMCEEGALENVSAIFGLHCWPGTDRGNVALARGPAMASSNAFTITVKGKGGHAAFPHQTIDPVLVSAHIITALQSICSRSTNPLDSSVVTVAQVNAGTAHNVIPDEVVMKGTFRSLKLETLKMLFERVPLIASKTAEAFGASAETEIFDGYPVLVNDIKASNYLAGIVQDTVGSGRFQDNEDPVMGAEDFSFYCQNIPGAFWWLGMTPQGQEPISVHTPRFDFDDEIIPTAVELHVEVARRFAAGWS